MYCTNCGKEISGDSRFCKYCGKASNKSKDAVSRWEYRDYVKVWPENDRPWSKGGKYAGYDKYLEYFWREYQSVILTELSQLFDVGWQPVTEIGPACLKIGKRKRGFIGSIFGNDLSVEYELFEARVKLKRQV
jgi:hypothetical protein